MLKTSFPISFPLFMLNFSIHTFNGNRVIIQSQNKNSKIILQHMDGFPDSYACSMLDFHEIIRWFDKVYSW